MKLETPVLDRLVMLPRLGKKPLEYSTVLEMRVAPGEMGPAPTVLERYTELDLGAMLDR